MPFATDTGLTVPAVTADQMREIDRIAIDETGPNLYQMMENAGRSLATLVMERHWSAINRSGVVVLAGSGGNGGGGIAAGRHLANHGVPVGVLLTDRSRLGRVPAQQLELLIAAGGDVRSTDSEPAPAVVIDALVGYGLRDAPHGRAVALIDRANRLGEEGAVVVSLDVPSGMEATSGERPGRAVIPDVTVTLDLPKHGLAVGSTGDLFLADIGIPAEVHRRAGVEIVEPIFDTRYVMPLEWV